MEKKVNLVNIKDGHLKATIEYYNPANGDAYETHYANECPPHDDLREAIERLEFHVSKICGTHLPGLRVEGYYRQPSGDAELLTIYAASRDDERACPVNLAARLHLGKDEYAWIDRLLEDLAAAEREALKYIEEGKRMGMAAFVTLENPLPAA